MKLGTWNILRIDRIKDVGAYLTDGKGLGDTMDVLLPTRQIPEGLEIGDKPREGACMVWSCGQLRNGNDGAGHVAIVEKVIDDNTVQTSESGWFDTVNYATFPIRKKGSNGLWGMASRYKFRGFIYNPKVKVGRIINEDGYWGRETTELTQIMFDIPTDFEISNQPRANKKYLPNAETASWKFKILGYKKGSDTVRALQTLIGAKADGYFGMGSVMKLQEFLKAKGFYKGRIDGYMGSDTVKGWQKYINAYFKD